MTNHPNRSKAHKFHDGQEVEVAEIFVAGQARMLNWRKAKIVASDILDTSKAGYRYTGFLIQFPDGTRAVFDAEHIRPTSIYQRWLSDNAREDNENSRKDWNAMIKTNEEYMKI